MESKTILGVVLLVLLSAQGLSNAAAEPAWVQALRKVEVTTGIHFVPDTDLPAEFTKLEADSNLLALRAYRESDDVGQATARLFIWKRDPKVVDWYATVPDFEKDAWVTYHADSTVEQKPLSAEFKKAHQKLLELTGRQ